jgi:hypothetical protein
MTACFGEDPELWFIGTKDAIEKAKAICGRCPIQQACGDHALEHGIEFGIWGGKTEDERKALLEGHPLPPPRGREGAPSAGAREGQRREGCDLEPLALALAGRHLHP